MQWTDRGCDQDVCVARGCDQGEGVTRVCVTRGCTPPESLHTLQAGGMHPTGMLSSF